MSLNVKKLNRRAVNQRQIDAIVREQLVLIYAAVGRVPALGHELGELRPAPEPGLLRPREEGRAVRGLLWDSEAAHQDGYDVKIRSSERKTTLVLSGPPGSRRRSWTR